MGKQKSPHGLINYRALTAMLCAVLFAAAMPGLGEAAATEARRLDDQRSVIEGMRMHQVGATEMMIELRGTKLPLPTAASSDNAATLVFSDTRFPRDTDRKNWWDEFEWDIFKLNLKKSEEWTQRYDFPLIEQVRVTSNDQQGITMNFIGPKPLVLKDISGMPGSDSLRIMLESPRDITPPPLIPKPRPVPAGDLLLQEYPFRRGIRLYAAHERTFIFFGRQDACRRHRRQYRQDAGTESDASV